MVPRRGNVLFCTGESFIILVFMTICSAYGNIRVQIVRDTVEVDNGKFARKLRNRFQFLIYR